MEKYFVVPNFKALPVKGQRQISFKKFNAFQTKPQIKLKYKDSAQAHLALGFLGVGYQDKNLAPIQLLATILGGSMSSRLFINIRERQGLCYYIWSHLDIYQDTGSLYIQAGLDKNRIFQAIKLILKELAKIKAKGITEDELKKAKEYFKGKMILGLEDSSAMAEWYARQQLLVGKLKTPEEKIAEIMKVTKSEVNFIARKTFQTKKMNLALIGPFESEKKFRKILKI